MTGVRAQRARLLPQVLDPRTRMILFKMLSRGVISEIEGCVSTGKEVSITQHRIHTDRTAGQVCLCSTGQRLPRQHRHGTEQSHQDLQDLHPALQGPRQIRQRRVQVTQDR